MVDALSGMHGTTPSYQVHLSDNGPMTKTSVTRYGSPQALFVVILDRVKLINSYLVVS